MREQEITNEIRQTLNEITKYSAIAEFAEKKGLKDHARRLNMTLNNLKVQLDELLSEFEKTKDSRA